jgi:hypothetical protein
MSARHSSMAYSYHLDFSCLSLVVFRSSLWHSPTSRFMGDFISSNRPSLVVRSGNLPSYLVLARWACLSHFCVFGSQLALSASRRCIKDGPTIRSRLCISWMSPQSIPCRPSNESRFSPFFYMLYVCEDCSTHNTSFAFRPIL